MTDLAAIFTYARQYADRSEASGRGTQFPTVRMAAGRFRLSQQAIVDMVDSGCYDGDGYLGLAVGIRAGGGHATFDKRGDYLIEAY